MSNNALHAASFSANRYPAAERPSISTPNRPKNYVLANLPQDVWNRVSPHIRHALLIPGQSLYGAGELAERVYFPNSGLVSLVMDSSEGSQVEVGVVGREGIVGVLAALSGQPSFGHALVQIAGNACWVPAALLRDEFRCGGALQDWLLRYIQVLNVQAAQCALCNRLHTVEERLSRWLLIVHDRIATNEIDITHEFIAQMLGARRSGVTVALGALQQAGFIDLARGHVVITDEQGLTKNTCECYSALRAQFETLKHNDGR
jgi:CRP-like cAMP-binding protein